MDGAAAEAVRGNLALLSQRPLRLELGCGKRKRNPSSVGVDIRSLDGVDIVGDALAVLRSLPDSSVDLISSHHFLEHFPDLRALLAEATRVLRPGGHFDATVPHFSNPYFYSDPTHRVHFGLYTLAYYVEGSPFRRQVPVYDDPLPYEFEDVDLVFKSAHPFYVRYALKFLYGKVVNATGWTREFWEENLCWLLPCYEVRYRLRRI